MVAKGAACKQLEMQAILAGVVVLEPVVSAFAKVSKDYTPSLPVRSLDPAP